MGDFYMKAVCYDDIARTHGKEVAQAKWEKSGHVGNYIPGYVAVNGFSDINGIVEGFTKYASDMSELGEAAFAIGVAGMSK